MSGHLQGLFGGYKGVAASDPNWTSVVLLVANDNAANGTTTFLDQSTYNHTTAQGGAAVYSTAQFPTGMSSSVALDGSLSFISITSATELNMGASDFTFEMYLRLSSVTGLHFLHTKRADSSVYGGYAWGPSGTDIRILVTVDGASWGLDYTPTVNLALNTWYHIELDRSGNSWYLFKDGTQLGTTQTLAGTVTTTTDPIRIGSDSDRYGVAGWVANVRITKGVARHTANFTPPTLPLPTQ